MGFFDFLNNVGAIFAEVASLITQLFAVLWNALSAALTFFWDVLVAFAGVVGGLFANVGKFVYRLWAQHLKPFFTTVYNIIDGIHDAIAKLLAPVMRIIARIQAIYYKYIYPYMHAILEIISRLRAALLVFRLMGFKWAAKLDADLAKIQAAVTKVMQDIVGALNGVITLLQAVIDPEMILRRDFFAHSLFGSLAGLKRAVGYGNNRPLTPDEQQRTTDTVNAVYGPGPLTMRNADGTYTDAPGFAPIDAETSRQFHAAGLLP
jgi:hypothetical protein